MRRIVILAVIVSFISSGAFAWTIKPQLGFGTLYEPKPSPEEEQQVSDIGGSMSKGGMNFAVQGIFGEDLFDVEGLKYGGEIGQLSFFSFSYEGEVFGTTLEASQTITSMPILGIVQYELGEGEGFSPYLHGGLGFFMNTVKVKLAAGGVTLVDDSESGMNLGIVFGGGGTLPAGETMTLDFSVKYYYVTEFTLPEKGMPGELLNICVGLCFEL